jgi:hypothetical protein
MTARTTQVLRASVPEPFISSYASDSERAQRIAEYRAVSRLADSLAREASDILTDTFTTDEYALASLIARALCCISPDSVNPLAVLDRARKMC